MNQTPVVSKPQGNSSTMKWLLIILVIIIVLGGGYWAYAKYGKGTVTTTASSSPTVTAKVSPSTSAKVSPTTSSTVPDDWKTYTNDTYGFSFKYPADWTLIEKGGYLKKEPALSIASSKTIDDYNKCSNDNYEGCVSSDISIWAYPSIANVYSDQPLGAKTIDELIAKTGTTTKTGTKNVGVVAATEVIEGGMAANYALMVIPDNGHFFEIFFDHWDGFENKPKVYNEIENQMLSTFQFTP